MNDSSSYHLKLTLNKSKFNLSGERGVSRNLKVAIDKSCQLWFWNSAHFSCFDITTFKNH